MNAPVTDGDTGFLGVDMNFADDTLPPGHLAYAENMRFSNGEARPRGGLSYNRAYSGKGAEFSWTFPIKFTDLAGVDAFGISKFSNPNGREYSVLLAKHEGWLVNEDYEPVRIYYPNNETITAPCDIVQAHGSLYVFRGEGLDPWYWNGQSPYDFKKVTQEFTGVTAGDDYGQPMPKAAQALYFNNRFFVPTGQDTLSISDIGAHNSFSVTNEFRVNHGEADSIVALHPFGRNTILIFKNDSIYALTNVYGDLSQMALELLTKEIGAVSKESIVNVGSDVLFYSTRGIFSIGQIDNNRNVVTGEPMSRPIQPLIDRVNWNRLSSIAASTFDNKIYWAVSLDNSTVNDAVLVYDQLTKKWAGMDTFAIPNFGIKGWFRATFMGQIRLMAHGTDGYVYMYEDNALGHDTKWKTSGYQFTQKLLTRAYMAGSRMGKNWTNVRLQVSTWHPSLKVDATTTGHKETQNLVTGLTRDPAKSTRFGSGPYTLNNSNGDLMDPYREDYYIDPSTSFYTTGGIELAKPQEAVFPFPCRQQDKAIQFELENSQGTLTLRGLEVVGHSHDSPKPST